VSAGEGDVEGGDADGDQVVILETTVVGAAESAPRPKSTPRFERSTPLPVRVRDGSFKEDHLDAGGEQIPWTSIKWMALGVIDQMVKDSELKKGPLRKMMQKVVGGEDTSSAKDRAKQTREVFILDVFTDFQDQPFRFEAGNINYKSFLDKVGYVSHHNFFRFCVHFARRVPHALITQSLAAFLAKRRDRVAHFPDFHDFELEIEQQFKFERDTVPMESVDLSNDSWVDEWESDDV
jgi:hypothetical protein